MGGLCCLFFLGSTRASKSERFVNGCVLALNVCVMCVVPTPTLGLLVPIHNTTQRGCSLNTFRCSSCSRNCAFVAAITGVATLQALVTARVSLGRNEYSSLHLHVHALLHWMGCPRVGMVFLGAVRPEETGLLVVFGKQLKTVSVCIKMFLLQVACSPAVAARPED